MLREALYLTLARTLVFASDACNNLFSTATLFGGGCCFYGPLSQKYKQVRIELPRCPASLCHQNSQKQINSYKP